MKEIPHLDPEQDARIVAAQQIFEDHSSMSIAMVVDGEPWAARVFFVDDEPDSGHLDLCCVMIGAARRDAVARAPRTAFVVGGDEPTRWIQGIGTAEIVSDDADGAAVLKRLDEKTPSAGAFLRDKDTAAVRIHVERLKVTDLSASPPVTEFTFA